MEKFKKIILTIGLVIFLPILSALYFSHAKDLLPYLYNGKETTASITSTKFKRGSRSSSCTIDYNYTIDGQSYSGHDSISGSCPNNVGLIRMYYLENNPYKSIISFRATVLSFPIFCLLIALLAIPFKILSKYRNNTNRKKFCISYIIACVVTITFILVVVSFSIFNPISEKDFLSFLLGAIYIMIGGCALKFIYDNIIKYNLYKDGRPLDAKIDYIKANEYKSKIQNYTVFYKYELDNKKYIGKENIPTKERVKYKIPSTIPILYNQYKKHISCLDV